jgi:hypothetical protein
MWILCPGCSIEEGRGQKENEMYTIILEDGTILTGNRPWWFSFRETTGFHHFRITSSSNQATRDLIGKRAAINLRLVKFITISEEK